MDGRGKIVVEVQDGKAPGPVLFDGVDLGLLDSLFDTPAAGARIAEAVLGLRAWSCFACRKPSESCESTDFGDTGGRRLVNVVLTCGTERCAGIVRDRLERTAADMRGLPPPKDGKYPVLAKLRFASGLPAEDFSSGPTFGEQFPPREIPVPMRLFGGADVGGVDSEEMLEILTRAAKPMVTAEFARVARKCIRCGLHADCCNYMQNLRTDEGFPWVFLVDVYPACGGCMSSVTQRYSAWYRFESKDTPRHFMGSCQGCSRASSDPKKEFQRCSRCGRAYYCSRECQRKDWPAHKGACRPKDAS